MHCLRLKDLLDGLADGFTGGFDGRAASESNAKKVV